MKLVLLILLIALLLFVLGSVGIALFIVMHFTYPKTDTLEHELNLQRDEPLYEYCDHVEYEEFSVTTRDHVTLGARLFMYHKDSNKFVILCHGHSVNQICPVRYIEPYKQAGYNVVTYDHRGHGGNAKTPCTMSLKESQDLLEVISYLFERFGKEADIGIQGESMGGATVIGSLRYSPNIRFVVADCPYASCDGFLRNTFKQMHVPVYLFDICDWLTKLLFGYRLSEVRPIDGINNSNVPMLLFHGLNDKAIPYSESQKIYDEYKGRKEIVLVEGADHAQDIQVDRVGYNKKVRAFLDSLE